MASNNQATAAWLARIDEMAAEIVPMTFPIEEGTLDIIKKMLLVPDDDDEAVDRAVREVQAFYSTKLFPPDDDFYRERPALGARAVVGSVVDQVFELAEVIPYKEVGHKRLADLLVGLKKNAAAGYDPENPQLTWSSRDLETHAADFWRGFNPSHTAPLPACTTALNTHALLARLVAANILPSPDSSWSMARCISDGLQDPPAHDFAADTPLVRTCRAVIAAQYILVAGDVLVRELELRDNESATAQADTAAVVRRGEWEGWRERLRILAAAGGGSDDDGEGVEVWNLRGVAEAAGRKVEGWLNSGV